MITIQLAMYSEFLDYSWVQYNMIMNTIWYGDCI